MSQAVNTLLVNQLNSSTRVSHIMKQKVNSHRLIDGLIAMIILSAAALCVSAYWRTGEEIEAAISKNQAAAQRVEDLKIETERLANEVKLLKTNPRFIESIARQNLGLVRPGDVVIKVNSEEENSNMRTLQAAENKPR